MLLVVLLFFVYFFGIFSLLVDTMLTKLPATKTKEISPIQHKSQGEVIYKIDLDNDDNETYTVL